MEIKKFILQSELGTNCCVNLIDHYKDFKFKYLLQFLDSAILGSVSLPLDVDELSNGCLKIIHS